MGGEFGVPELDGEDGKADEEQNVESPPQGECESIVEEEGRFLVQPSIIAAVERYMRVLTASSA